MFQVGVVGRDYPFHLFLIEGFQDCFGYSPSQHGFCTGAEFIDQDQGIFISVAEKVFHVDEVWAIGTQIVFNGLLVTHVDEYFFENTEPACFTDRYRQATLKHILQ